MGYSQNDLIMGNEMLALKVRLNNEIDRRDYRNKNLLYNKYNSTISDWQYTQDPASGVKANFEHINKILTPLRAINTQGVPEQTEGGLITAVDYASTALAVHEAAKPRKDSTCNAECVGMCTNACHGNCTGSCVSQCKNATCTGQCLAACGTQCLGSRCTTMCTGACKGHCSNGCADLCGGCLSQEAEFW